MSSSTSNLVVVLGGGPAGMSAAIAAAQGGARVIIVESGRIFGGQYWRHMPARSDKSAQENLHHGWNKFLKLREEIESHPRITVSLETNAWSIACEPGVSKTGLAVETVTGPADSAERFRHTLHPDALVIATGAHDRTLPFPGWNLPGVYSGGAAQALAKGEGIPIGKRVIVAGAGPFLLPVAASLTQVGARVLEVDEASGIGSLTRGWLPRPWELAGAPNKITELLEYVGGQIRNRVPYRIGQAVVRAEGDGHIQRAVIAKIDADWRPIPGTERTVECDALCVTHGFTPRLEAAIAAGCELDKNRFVVIGDDCQTSVPGVYAAGELTGIGGVDLAMAEGSVAGYCAAGGHSSAPAISSAQRKRAVFAAFARRIEQAHGIASGWTEWVSDDTMVCRCEEVTAAELRSKAKATKSSSLRSQKLSTRAGLGMCQGRICGRSAEELICSSLGVSSLDEGIIDRRPIHIPIRLGELASGDTENRSGNVGPSPAVGTNPL